MERYSIAIDLGGTRIKLGILANQTMIAKKIVQAQPVAGLAGVLEQLHAEIELLISDNQLDPALLQGVGLAFPGIVNPLTKRILSTNQKYDDAPGIDVEKWVKDLWHTQFYIENDARMACVGEWKSGAGQDSNDLVVVTIGTGIGTSIIMDGKLLRGKHFQAGCLGGHFSVRYDGRICTCGNIGCMEAHASTWSIKERAQESAGFVHSQLSEAPVIDFKTLFKAAREHDPLAVSIKHECLDVWSAGIISLIHAYDPEVVVLGGGVLNSGPEIMPYIAEKVKRHAWCPSYEVQLRQSSLLSNACLWGLHYCLQHNV